MKKNSFSTIEEAKLFLEERRKKAYQEIEIKNDVVLADNSFVSQDLFNPDQYTTFLLIYSKQMIEDLKNFECIDYNAQLEYEIKKLNDI
jgi:hypothetical protein